MSARRRGPGPELPVLLLALLALLPAGCTALRPGPGEALRAGRPERIVATGDSLSQAWWTWRRGDLAGAGRLAGGRLPAAWQEELLDWAAAQTPSRRDSLAALAARLAADPPAAVSGLARRWGREGRLLPDSLFLLLAREPAEAWRSACRAGSIPVLTLLIMQEGADARPRDLRELLTRPTPPDAAFIRAWGRRVGLGDADLERLARRGLWTPLAAWLDESPPATRAARRLQAEALAHTGRRARALDCFRALDDGRDEEIRQWIRLLERQAGGPDDRGGTAGE